MKKTISLILCVIMMICAVPLFSANAGAEGNPFKDVKEGKWYTKAALWCYERGYMSGVSADEFGVNTQVTRAMFVTILAKIDGADLSGYEKNADGLPFTDIKATGYYVRALKWAYENKYTSGVSATNFGPNDPVSREQLATFLRTYAQAQGRDVAASVDLSAYADGASVSRYARKAISWAVAAGMISGTGDNMLSPGADATRAQIAVIIRKFVENVLAAKRLKIEADGTNALVTGAEDLAFMMYAKGDAYTDDEFIAAYRAQFSITEDEMTAEFVEAHNTARHDDLDGNASLSIGGLYGSYTFHVVYRNGESENVSLYFDPGTEYPVGSIELGGVDISEYTIVYGVGQEVEDITMSGLASELSQRIKEMTGAEVPVISDTERVPADGAREILIGRTDREEGYVTVDRGELIYDTLHIEVQNGFVILTGKEEDSGGTHMAVFEFLRRLGCTYYTDDFYHIEPAEKIEMDEGYVLHIRPTMDFHQNYQRGGSSVRLGQTSEAGLRFCNIVHTLPEFAAEDYEDKWSFHLQYYLAAEPCLTNSEVIRRIITNVKTKIGNSIAKGNKEPLLWLTMSDGSVRGCQCENCRKMYHTFGAHSTYSYILKYVGDAIKDEYPTAKIVGIAYKYTITAPRTDVTDEEYAEFLADWTEDFVPDQKLKAPSNAIMCIATDNSCSSHAIDDPDCNPKVNGNVTFNKNFERYCDIFDTVYVWAYFSGDYCRYTVFPNIDQMWEQYNYFYRHGVTGMYGFGRTSRYGDFCELHTYIDAFLSIDSSITKEEYYLKVNKFLEDFYGPGWKELRAYMDLTDNLGAKNHWNSFTQARWEYIISEEDWRANVDGMDEMVMRAVDRAVTEKQRTQALQVYTTVICTRVRLAYIDYKASGSQEDLERFKAINNEFRDLLVECRLKVPDNWTEELDPTRWILD